MINNYIPGRPVAREFSTESPKSSEPRGALSEATRFTLIYETLIWYWNLYDPQVQFNFPRVPLVIWVSRIIINPLKKNDILNMCSVRKHVQGYSIPWYEGSCFVEVCSHLSGVSSLLLQGSAQLRHILHSEALWVTGDIDELVDWRAVSNALNDGRICEGSEHLKKNFTFPTFWKDCNFSEKQFWKEVF